MRMANGRVLAVMALVWACGLSGCGGATNNGPPTKLVQGTVKLGGTPLLEGSISFQAVKGDESPMVATIKKGYYSIPVTLGEKRVSITSRKVLRMEKAYNSPDSPMRPIYGELVPAKYNTRSELARTIDSGKINGDFDLEAEPEKK